MLPSGVEMSSTNGLFPAALFLFLLQQTIDAIDGAQRAAQEGQKGENTPHHTIEAQQDQCNSKEQIFNSIHRDLLSYQ